MNGLLFAAIVERVNTRKDNTLGVTLGLQEVSPATAGQLVTLNNRLVAVYLSEKEKISQEEIDQVDKIDRVMEGKSPSQRMRNVLYILFTQNEEGYKTFDEYYRGKMETIINHLKSKIQE